MQLAQNDPGFSLQTLKPMPQEGDLGDLTVVNALISQFVGEVSQDLAALDPSLSQDEHIQRHLVICRRYASRWGGKDPAYIPMPWHGQPAFLQFLLDHAHIEASTAEDGVYCLFALLLKDLYSITDRLASGKITDEIGQWQLAGMMEYVATVLLGGDMSEYEEEP